jgi:hypothetical protein
MALDRMMHLLAAAYARNSAPSADPAIESGLLARVRSGLLQAAMGQLPPGLNRPEGEALQRWASSVGGAPGVPALYQELLRRTLRLTPGGEIKVDREKTEHRAMGAFYTDEPVGRYLLARAKQYIPDAGTVIDPACGAGALLQMAREQYGPDAVLVGCDSDALALQLCESLLPQVQVHCTDGLLDPPKGSWDLCVGNPPYISSGLRGAVKPDSVREKLLRKRFAASAQYKLNTYPLFIEAGLERLREGGVLAYILPDSFLTGRYFERLRRVILSHTLLELCLIQADFWRHGRVGQTVLLFLRKGPAPLGHQVLVKVCPTPQELERTAEVHRKVSEIVWGDRVRFRLIKDPDTASFIRQIEATAGTAPLGSFVRSYSGLIGRQGQSSLLHAVERPCIGPVGRLLRSGREIDRYQIRWGGERVCLAPERIKSGGHLSYYQNPKILLRQTADSIRAAYDDQGFYCLNNVHLLVPRSEAVDLLVILAILNSAVFHRLYTALTMETGRLFAQVDLDLLETLPIPPITAEASRRLNHLVQQRAKAAPEEAALCEMQIDGLVAELYHLGSLGPRV